MMIHAYRETYLSNAQSVLGDAFHYAVSTCNISGSDFIKLFVASFVSKHIRLLFGKRARRGNLAILLTLVISSKQVCPRLRVCRY